jgi:hydroxyethylthiazole kinase-like uncharacterized protein yjeF
MKILTAHQLKEADRLTIEREKISSLQLMERASIVCFNKILEALNNLNGKPFNKKLEFLSVFCGVGNNGGDGLVIARKLIEAGFTLKLSVVCFKQDFSPNFNENFERLNQLGVDIRIIRSESDIPEIFPGGWIIDAIFGMGLTKPVKGFTATLIKKINASHSKVISVDMPSGLPTDPETGFNPKDAAIIKANQTFTFQFPKPSLFLKTGAEKAGKWSVLDIGLDKTYTDALVTEYKVISPELLQEFYRPRERFTHKYNYGNILVLAGSTGKFGAAILASKACLHSGAGLITLHAPTNAMSAIAAAVPEIMFSNEKNKDFISVEPEAEFDVLLAGPGLGQESKTFKVLRKMLSNNFKKHVVLDADALNLFAKFGSKDDFKLLENKIITPHPKEFERLFGVSSNDDFGQFVTARKIAAKYNCVVVLKNAITQIFCPKGKVYFNLTGNPGLATGGSGDVLAGFIASLLGQGYDITQAAVGSVYLHGKAADLVAQAECVESVTPSKTIEFFPKALRESLKNT